MKYSLRNLMIVALVVLPALACIYFLVTLQPKQLPSITGSVTINGTQATLVMLEFQFSDGTRGAAMVGDDGEFTLDNSSMSNQGHFSYLPTSARVAAWELQPGKTPIPSRYRNMETTPLSVPISPNSENKFTLEILAP